MALVTIISFLVVLSILVLVHELGHFVVGRLVHAKIEEFAIGFPPRVWSVRRGETDYSINALPLGGYVRFAGEDNPDVPSGLAAQPRRERAAVLLAGVTMNVILAIILFTAVYVIGMPVANQTADIKLARIESGSPAEQAGLQVGDTVVSVDGRPVNNLDDFSAYIRSHSGQQVSLLVKRASGAEETVRLTPRTAATTPAGQGPLGVSLENAGYHIEQLPFGQAVSRGLHETYSTAALTVKLPIMMLRNTLPPELAGSARVVGPIGVGRMVGTVAEAVPVAGWAPLLYLMAALSINLAIVNILPLPGLDGGRLLFVVIEWLRGGKRVNPQREAVFHLAGMLFLIGVILIVTYYDIVSPVPLR